MHTPSIKNIESSTPCSLSFEELRQALSPICLELSPSFDSTAPFHSIATDSRKVVSKGVFIAINGETEDGWQYVKPALENGAKIVIGEKKLGDSEKELLASHQAAYMQVQDSRIATSLIAPLFYGTPCQSLRIIGVTGTNGKTTTTTLLHQLFTRLGYRCGLIGTIENRIGDRIEPTKLTTPDAITLQKLFYEMKQDGCTFVFMEVSSHALAQHRTDGIPFEGAVFTNLTRDHLDYHGDMLHYQKAKKRLFDSLSKHAFALVNGDDKAASYMLQNCGAGHYSYALKSPADFYAKVVEEDFDGTEILIEDTPVWVKLTGTFNMYNLLSVWATAKLLLPALDGTKLLTAISNLDHAKGRFEVIRSERCTAIIDYAHTPDALIKVLDTIADVASPNTRIIVVVGAGGDRDKGKRPFMAREAYQRCQQLILTTDNPRFEDPRAIIEEMKEGLTAEEQLRILSITDRREAIRTAICMASPQDVVLVAGKGHENYQEVKGIRHHFDDKEEIQIAMGIGNTSSSDRDHKELL